MDIFLIIITILSTIGISGAIISIVYILNKLKGKVDKESFSHFERDLNDKEKDQSYEISNLLSEIEKLSDQLNLRIDQECDQQSLDIKEVQRIVDEQLIGVDGKINKVVDLLDQRCDKIYELSNKNTEEITNSVSRFKQEFSKLLEREAQVNQQIIEGSATELTRTREFLINKYDKEISVVNYNITSKYENIKDYIDNRIEDIVKEIKSEDTTPVNNITGGDISPNNTTGDISPNNTTGDNTTNNILLFD